jgi:hypothetical protein
MTLCEDGAEIIALIGEVTRAAAFGLMKKEVAAQGRAAEFCTG